MALGNSKIGQTNMSSSDRLDRVKFFPSVHAGMSRTCKRQIITLVRVAWHLMITGRTIIEDAIGAENKNAYIFTNKLALTQLLFVIDSDLKGVDAPSDLHRLALAFELGYSEVARVPPEDIASFLGLDTGELGATHLVALWDHALDSFPAELPDPLLGGAGQMEFLNVLRDWSSLLEMIGSDSSFLAHLYKSI